MKVKDEVLDIPHAGEMLHTLLDSNKMTASQLAMQIKVPANRIYHIINGNRAITADTALRLGKYFGVQPMMFMKMQADYELSMAEFEIKNELNSIFKKEQSE